MKISEVAIKRPVFATMMIGALLVLGWFSYGGLQVNLFPEVDFPFVVVQTLYPGASAEAVETEVSKRIEDVANEVSGVRHITARSREGYSLIFVEFILEKEGAVAAQEVRAKVAAIRADLPDDAEEPIVSQYDPGAQAVMSFAISGKRSPREITEIVKTRIKPRLETVSGIGSVDIIGGSEREILVALNPDRMEYYEITVQDVQNSVRAANLEIPGGRVTESSTEYVVRMQGRLENVSDFEDIVVKNRNGSPIYLSDLARVADTVAEQRSLARYNGNSAVSLNVIKQSGANLVDMARAVKATVNDLKKELPPDIDIQIVLDNSTFIEDSIHEIVVNIQLGTILAVLVIFLFLLNIRPTIITGLSIPISIIATFTLMKMLGFSVNFMTLLGLSLAVGILIDDAIVVIENIYRHIDEGKSPMEAAFSGTKEIGLAVMATTFAIMVVFLPVAFMEDIVGRFFFQFGMTVAFAVLISLFVAFTLTPMLSSRWLKSRSSDQSKDVPTGALSKFWGRVLHYLGYWNRFFDSFRPLYRRVLVFSLAHRWVVILTAVASFALAMFAAQFVGSEFMTETDEAKMVVTFSTPPGTTLKQTSDRCAEVEGIVQSMTEVIASFVTIGGVNTPVTDGRILFKLTDASDRQLTAKELMDSTRVLLRAVPGIKYSVGRGDQEGGGEKPVEISVQGDDRDEIARLIHEVQAIVYETAGATDVDNTLEEGKPEINVAVRRQAADDLGLNLAVIPMTIRGLIEGDVVTRYKEGDEEYDVRVQLDRSRRSSLQDISRMLIKSEKEIPGRKEFLVPLGSVADITRGSSIGEYLRFDRQNEARVNANVLTGAFAGTVSGLIMEKAAELRTPPGYNIKMVGSAEMMERSFTSILRALFLSIIFIYLLLASQYESFTDPLSIMFSLPLSLVGAILGLLGSSFSIMSLIGIVMLMGLVTKNAILLIDFVKQRRQRGIGRTEAILDAGPIRLRPILMTTFATVFGMLPLALGLGPGAELRSPMARAVIGGMLSSTLLTMVVVPVVYTIVDDVTVFVFGRRRKTEAPVLEGVAAHGESGSA